MNRTLERMARNLPTAPNCPFCGEKRWMVSEESQVLGSNPTVQLDTRVVCRNCGLRLFFDPDMG